MKYIMAFCNQCSGEHEHKRWTDEKKKTYERCTRCGKKSEIVW